ncbi:MAG: ABC transporter permease subunit [Desulfuromonadales bacterium]|nr:ABC transporter permease subunit [Desulfuromonadales bacterium]
MIESILKILCQAKNSFLWAVRDRILHAIFGMGFLLLLMVPIFSNFSMRQVQESSISLVLSFFSTTLLAVAVLLGSAAIFRDVDRRYTASVLGLPLSRAHYLLGRFAGLSLFLIGTACILMLFGAAVIAWSMTIYPASQPVDWWTVILAFVADTGKAILVAALALLFSSLSTSFTLPFFCSLGIWLAGSASQEAYDYIQGPLGDDLPQTARWFAELFYYLLPNFSGMNYHLHAVYGLPVVWSGVLISFAYTLLYGSVVVWLAMFVFGRRELP